MKFATDLAEIVLVVEDVGVAAKFYEEVVGLSVHRPANDDWAWFWMSEPGIPRRLALHKGPLLFEENSPYPAGQRWGRVHVAFNVPGEVLEEQPPTFARTVRRSTVPRASSGWRRPHTTSTTRTEICSSSGRLILRVRAEVC